jgi:hypothetical protein
MSGAGHTGATNGWQKILKGSGYEGYNITTVRVMLSNDGSAVSTVLKIYAGVTDDTSANPNTRFAGLTAVATSPAVSVETDDGTKVAFDFDFTGTTLTGTNYSFWIQKDGGGSLGSMQVQKTSSGTDGGAGNTFGTLNHEVFGVPA